MTIDKMFRKAKKSFYLPNNSSQFSFENALILPYSLGILSIKFLLKSTFDIKVVFTYPNTIMSFLVQNNNSLCPSVGGVYAVPCGVCHSSYIGETLKSLQFRLTQHKNDINRGNYSNSIFKHIRDSQHNIDWNGSSMIFSSKNKTLNQLIESYFINTTPNFNTSEGFFSLDRFTIVFVKNSITARFP